MTLTPGNPAGPDSPQRPPRSGAATRAILAVAGIIAGLCLLGGVLLVAAAFFLI